MTDFCTSTAPSRTNTHLRERASRRLALLAIVATLIMLSGCATGVTAEQARADVQWDYTPDALQLEIDASPRLNEYQNAPHTLLLTIFQMADAQAFRDLAGDPERLRAALAAGASGTGIVQITRYVVAPGARVALSIDRAQQVRCVGIVAGYYDVDDQRAARLYDVPLKVNKRGWFSRSYHAAPLTLELKMRLGAQSITDAREQSLRLPPPGAGVWTLDRGIKVLALPADAEGDEASAQPKRRSTNLK
ncbi:type VI secretion system lipoprotein TssJ [Burkholderia pyrrocinia]